MPSSGQKAIPSRRSLRRSHGRSLHSKSRHFTHNNSSFQDEEGEEEGYDVDAYFDDFSSHEDEGVGTDPTNSSGPESPMYSKLTQPSSAQSGNNNSDLARKASRSRGQNNNLVRTASKSRVVSGRVTTIERERKMREVETQIAELKQENEGLRKENRALREGFEREKNETRKGMLKQFETDLKRQIGEISGRANEAVRKELSEIHAKELDALKQKSAEYQARARYLLDAVRRLLPTDELPSSSSDSPDNDELLARLLAKRIQSLCEENEVLFRKKERADTALKDLQRSTENSIRAFQRQLTEKNAEIEKLRREHLTQDNTFEEKTRKVEVERDRLLKGKEELEKKLEEMRKKLSDREDALDELAREHSLNEQRLKKDVAEKAGIVAQLEGEIKKLRSQVQELKSDREKELRRLRQDYDKEFQKLRSTADSEHEVEIRRLEEELSYLRKDLVAKADEVSAIRAELEERPDREEYDQVRKDKSKLEGVVQALQGELASVGNKLHSSLRQAEGNVREIEQERSELQEKVAHLEQTIRKMERGWQEKGNQMFEEARERELKLEEELELWQGKAAAAMEEKEQEAMNAEEERRALHAKLNDARSEMKRLKKELERRERDISELQEQLSSAKARISWLQTEELENVRREAAQDTQRTLNAKIMELAKANDTARELKERVKEQERAIAALRNELDLVNEVVMQSQLPPTPNSMNDRGGDAFGKVHLEAQVLAHERELHDVRKRYGEMLSELSGEMDLLRATLERRRNSYRAKLRTLEQEALSYRTEADGLRREIMALKSASSNSGGDYGGQDEHIWTLEQRNATLEEELAQLLDKNMELVVQLSQLRKD
ncbi:uncharacterized protein VTP21DRAFT_3776 [Calcarisporiella thermophila]|uniref:uncharacterized protein n=1 Tax=Calcarisporiella thermophila TaxID=911321 RepID=UPI0037428A3D